MSFSSWVDEETWAPSRLFEVRGRFSKRRCREREESLERRCDVELLNLEKYKAEIHRTLISKLDLEKLSRVNSSQARQAVSGIVKEIIADQRVPLNFDEQEKIQADLLDEIGRASCRENG